MGLSENSVPHLPNGFADHYPYFLWLFHWGYTPGHSIPSQLGHTANGLGLKGQHLQPRDGFLVENASFKQRENASKIHRKWMENGKYVLYDV